MIRSHFSKIMLYVVSDRLKFEVIINTIIKKLTIKHSKYNIYTEQLFIVELAVKHKKENVFKHLKFSFLILCCVPFIRSLTIDCLYKIFK